MVCSYLQFQKFNLSINMFMAKIMDKTNLKKHKINRKEAVKKEV